MPSLQDGGLCCVCLSPDFIRGYFHLLPLGADRDGLPDLVGESSDGSLILVVSHPSRKDKDAARMGHPADTVI